MGVGQGLGGGWMLQDIDIYIYMYSSIIIIFCWGEEGGQGLRVQGVGFVTWGMN